MLWAYFDESGEHDRVTGHLQRLTLGGCVAPFEKWQAFSLEWASTLEAAGVRMFHMVDFRNRAHPFTDWPEDRRDALLEKLLDIMARHIPTYMAITATVNAPNKAFRKTYDRGLVGAIVQTANLSERVALVFAMTTEVRLATIEDCFGEIDFGDSRLNSATIANATTTCPLQAADIIAYECMQACKGGTLNAYGPAIRRLQGHGEVFYHNLF